MGDRQAGVVAAARRLYCAAWQTALGLQLAPRLGLSTLSSPYAQPAYVAACQELKATLTFMPARTTGWSTNDKVSSRAYELMMCASSLCCAARQQALRVCRCKHLVKLKELGESLPVSG